MNESLKINEVSKGLVQRAYKKATGAQKNRIKKLYKEIYGDDITKGDVSHIKFNVHSQFQDENEIINLFKYWDQDTLDNISKIDVDEYDDGENTYNLDITIDGKTYYANIELDDEEGNIENVDSNYFDGDEYIGKFADYLGSWDCISLLYDYINK